MNPTESMQMFRLAEALFTLSLFAFLYSLGGRKEKWLRRFLGSTLFCLGCNLIAFQSNIWSIWMLGGFVTYPIALSLGYGGNTTATKLFRRTLYGLALGLASIPFLIHQPSMILFQTLLSMSISIWWGIKNPTSAVGEEGAIGALSVILIPFLLIK